MDSIAFELIQELLFQDDLVRRHEEETHARHATGVAYEGEYKSNLTIVLNDSYHYPAGSETVCIIRIVRDRPLFHLQLGY